jgi:hypothetical protein
MDCLQSAFRATKKIVNNYLFSRQKSSLVFINLFIFRLEAKLQEAKKETEELNRARKEAQVDF